MSRRPPSLAPFRVFDACRQGLRMVVESRAFLFRQSVPAVLAAIVTGFLVSQTPDISPLRLFMLSLPFYILTGLLIGTASRHWLLGETPLVPADDTSTRRSLLQASVMTFVLWKAAVAVYEQLLVQIADPAVFLTDPSRANINPAAQLVLMVAMGILFWGLRFRLLPVLAAVGYSLKSYAVRANSFMLSFRLLGMVLVCVELPRALVLATLASSINSNVFLYVAQLALTVALELWLFAAFVAALRQMLGQTKGKA